MAQFPSDTEWAAAPGTDDGFLCGRNADSKGAFFGGTPISRPVLPAVPDAQDVADALVALGLVSQSA